jgi:hypothetical protein
MELDRITPQQAAERWNITDRRVHALCANGQIEGAVYFVHFVEIVRGL